MLLQNVFTKLDNKINDPKLNNSLKDFFEKIIDVVSLLGGELNSVI